MFDASHEDPMQHLPSMEDDFLNEVEPQCGMSQANSRETSGVGTNLHKQAENPTAAPGAGSTQTSEGSQLNALDPELRKRNLRDRIRAKEEAVRLFHLMALKASKNRCTNDSPFSLRPQDDRWKYVKIIEFI